MRVLIIVHQADAGPGVFAAAADAAGHELVRWHPPAAEPVPRLEDYEAILSFGGGMQPDEEESHPWLIEEKRLLARALKLEVPLLGVCLGAELLAEAAGGTARGASTPEIGWYSVTTTPAAGQDPLMAVLPTRFEAFEWHSYEFLLPPGAVALATSEGCLQAYRAGPLAWGIQFHAEVPLEGIEAWLRRHSEKPDARELEIDSDELRRQTQRLIGEWNRIGNELCSRFLELASRVSEPRAG